MKSNTALFAKPPGLVKGLGLHSREGEDMSRCETGCREGSCCPRQLIVSDGSQRGSKDYRGFRFADSTGPWPSPQAQRSWATGKAG